MSEDQPEVRPNKSMTQTERFIQPEQIGAMSFYDVHKGVMSAQNIEDRNLFVRERFSRVQELQYISPSLVPFLHDEIAQLLQEGWNNGPAALLNRQETIVNQAKAIAPSLSNARYDGIVIETIAGIANEAWLERELQNPKLPAQERQKKEEELQKVRRDLQVLKLGVDVSKEMTEGGKRKVAQREQELRSLSFGDIMQLLYDPTLNPTDRAKYEQERNNRVLELQTKDQAAIRLIGDRVVRVLVSHGREESPDALVRETEAISKQTQVEHPILSDPRFLGVDQITIGGIVREAKVLNRLRQGNLSQDEIDQLRQELNNARKMQVLDLKINIAGVLKEGEKRKVKQSLENARQMMQAQQGQPNVNAAAQFLNTQQLEQLSQAVRGEILRPLPPTEQEQEKIVMPLLEQIEEEDTFIAPVPGEPQSAFAPQDMLRRLKEYLAMPNCSESLKRRVMARLRLQHCSTTVRTAKNAGDKSASLKAGFQLAESAKYALDANIDFRVLFNEERNIPIADAFDTLEQAYNGGINVGSSLINLGEDDSDVNKVRVNNHILQQLGGGKEAKKALQLAWRISDATLSSNVWNHSLVPGDLISEATHFREMRQGKFKSARDVGPPATIKTIPSLSTSYFRWAKTRPERRVALVDRQGHQKVDSRGNIRTEKVNDYLAFNYPDMNINLLKLDERIPFQDKIRAIDLRNKGYYDPDPDNPNPSRRIYNRLDVRNLPYDEISQDNSSYKTWITYVVPQQLKAQELLLQTDVAPDIFGFDKFEGYKSTFGQVDGGSAVSIREQFVYGILNYVLHDSNSALTLKWDDNTLEAALQNIVRPDNPANPESSFLTKEELQSVLDRLANDGTGHYAVIRAKLNFANSMRRLGWF